MSVTQYYDRLGDDAVAHFRDDRETFRVEDYPDCESVHIYGQECLLIGDLAAQATTGASQKKLVSGAVSGFAGVPVYDDGDFPFLIERRTAELASRLMDDLRPEDLRRACDLGRLKAQYREVEEWLWEDWGPNVFEEQLLPKFEMVRGLYRRAAEREQQVIVGWF
ncbi:MAG TPA: hypothetical protein VH575_12035 [Gemmataceae bacterium]